MKINLKDGKTTELCIKWCPWLVLAILYLLEIFLGEAVYVFTVWISAIHPLYVALLCHFDCEHNYLKGFYKIALLLSPYILFKPLGSIKNIFDFREGLVIAATELLLGLCCWSLLYLIRFLKRRKKHTLLIFKTIPYIFTVGIFAAINIIPFKRLHLENLNDSLGGIFIISLLILPLYLSALNSLEKNYRFSRGLLELSLCLLPSFLFFLYTDDFTRALTMIYCIYAYAAMIISWTLFYFIRKFYDKKYKAKAVEAEN